jgi:hypothetical protein
MNSSLGLEISRENQIFSGEDTSRNRKRRKKRSRKRSLELLDDHLCVIEDGEDLVDEDLLDARKVGEVLFLQEEGSLEVEGKDREELLDGKDCNGIRGHEGREELDDSFSVALELDEGLGCELVHPEELLDLLESGHSVVFLSPLLVCFLNCVTRDVDVMRTKNDLRKMKDWP